MENVGVTPNGIMARAVYLRDLDDMVNSGTHLAQDPSREWYVDPGHETATGYEGRGRLMSFIVLVNSENLLCPRT